MDIGDKVRATRDIRSFIPETLRIADDAIPMGMEGIVLQQDCENLCTTVKFDNGIIGNFGIGIVDELDAITTVSTIEKQLTSVEEIQAEVTASIRAEQIASSRMSVGAPPPIAGFGGTSFGPRR